MFGSSYPLSLNVLISIHNDWKGYLSHQIPFFFLRLKLFQESIKRTKEKINKYINRSSLSFFFYIFMFCEMFFNHLHIQQVSLSEEHYSVHQLFHTWISLDPAHMRIHSSQQPSLYLSLLKRKKKRLLSKVCMMDFFPFPEPSFLLITRGSAAYDKGATPSSSLPATQQAKGKRAT